MAGPAPIGRRERGSSLVTRGRLFLVSYAPLALIFACRLAQHHLIAAVVWGGIAILGLVDGWRLVHSTGRRGSRTVQLESVQDAGGGVAAYLATYLLPFISTWPSAPGELAAYVLYFAVLIVVFVRSDMAFVNPTLYVLGWRVVDASHLGRRVLVVCRESPAEGSEITVVDFLDVYVVKGKPRDDHRRIA